MIKKFHNRTQAGRLLAQQLKPNYSDRADVLVLALPRGGVPVAYEIAQVLHTPLDLCMVRKLGVPGHEELAMGAIATGGTKIWNQDLLGSMNISSAEIAKVIAKEQRELQRRDRLYRGACLLPNLSERTVIIVDDGIATGSTLKAALSAIKQQQPKQIVVAVPVAPPDVCQELKLEVDEVFCLLTPECLHSISLWYEDFSPTTDEQVRNLLAQNTNQFVP